MDEFFKRRSKNSEKFAVASPSAAAIILKLHRKSNMQSCNQLEGGSKNLLFFDQLDKGPESGLVADDSCSNCVRRSFFLPFSRPPSVKEKKNARSQVSASQSNSHAVQIILNSCLDPSPVYCSWRYTCRSLSSPLDLLSLLTFFCCNSSRTLNALKATVRERFTAVYWCTQLFHSPHSFLAKCGMTAVSANSLIDGYCYDGWSSNDPARRQ